MRKTLSLVLFMVLAVQVDCALAIVSNPFKSKLPVKIIEPPKETVKPNLSSDNKPKIERPKINKPVDTPVKPVVKQELPLPQLIISGIIWNTNRPQAIINNQVVDIGDEVFSTKIVSIQKSGIELLFDGRLVKLQP